AGRWVGLPVCADHAGRVHRDSGGKEQLRSRNRQLHAEHGKQRGNVTGYNLDRAPFAISSAAVSGECKNRQSELCERRAWLDSTICRRRTWKTRGNGNCLRAAISIVASASSEPRLHRHLHGSIGSCRRHVLSEFYAEEK